MRSPLRLALLALVASTSQAGAQQLRGTVYDSLAGAPLGGAEVQLVSRNDPAAPLAGRAVTDSLGGFVIAGLAPGDYAATFYHPVLDLLGLEAPVRPVVVTGGASVMHLAVPGGGALHELLCDARAPADSSGAILGALLDGSTRLPATGGVIVQWIDLVIGAGGVRRRVEQRSVAADPVTGRFLVCGVPGGVEVAVQGTRGADTTGMIPVDVAPRAIVRRDVWLGALGDANAVVRVSGRIESRDRRGIAGARVMLTGSDVTVLSDSAGRFVIPVAPPGSRTMLVRALGYMPAQRPVDLVGGHESVVHVQLESVQSVLDTVRVIAQRLYLSDRTGFEGRRRTGTGTFFGEAEIQRLRPVVLSELFRRIPSARVDEVDGEKYLRMRGATSACTPVVFLDGQRITALGLADLDRFVQPADVIGVEVYSKELAPAEFTTLEECGSVVIWTGARRPPRGGR